MSVTVEFEEMTPIFPVRDLDVSVDYYVRVLGFRKGFHEPGIIAAVGRSTLTIFLTEGDQGNPPTYLWVGVTDVDRLHDELRRSGARIRRSPTNYAWGYEMQVEDPDGNVLRFGSERREGQSLGNWLDMRGVEWAPQRDGGWKRVTK